MNYFTQAKIVAVLFVAVLYVAAVISWKLIALISSAFNPWLGGGILIVLFINKMFD